MHAKCNEPFSKCNIDEEIEGGVENNEDMTNVLDGLDPWREVDNGGLLIAVDQLVNGGNKLPDVAETPKHPNMTETFCGPKLTDLSETDFKIFYFCI